MANSLFSCAVRDMAGSVVAVSMTHRAMELSGLRLHVQEVQRVLWQRIHIRVQDEEAGG